MATLRVPFAVGSGGFLSLSLFYALWLFVATPAHIDLVHDPIRVKFTVPRPATQHVSKRDPKVEREPPVFIPEGPRIGDDQLTTMGSRASLVPVDIDTGVVIGGKFGPTDRDPVPLVRISPDYPHGAAGRDIEGWVQVQFSITPTGEVRDAFVVAADPPGWFEDAALKAIARWRYQPRIQGGVATERVGVQTLIRFDLEED